MSLLKEIKQDNTSRVLELLQGPQDLNILDKKSGNSLLHIAISNQNEIILKALLSHNPQPDLNIYNDDGVPPLSYAIELNNLDAIQELLKAGANVNYPTQEDNLSPLQIASEYNLPQAIKILLKNNADVNYSSQQGTALHLAIKKGSEEAAYVLMNTENLDYLALDSQSGDSVMHLAVYHGMNNLIQMLFENTEKIPELKAKFSELLNIQNKNGDSVLIVAEKEQKYSISTFLYKKGVEYGLDINLKNLQGLTAEKIKENFKKKSLEEVERKKQEHDITTEKKLERILEKKKEKDNQELQNQLFEQKKKELEEIRREQYEEAMKNQKKYPYICIAIVIGILLALYLYLDFVIKEKQDNYLDL